jgi:uncharacterized membrane protein
MALAALRFVNVLLAAFFAGNGVGATVFFQPALNSLGTEAQVEAQRAITRRFGRAMRLLMPAFVASCLAMLGLTPDRRSAAFRLSLAGTAGFVAMLGLTAAELPLNRRTLAASPAAPPADWQELRARWGRYNALRTACEVAGWGGLYLGALAAAREGR